MELSNLKKTIEIRQAIEFNEKFNSGNMTIPEVFSIIKVELSKRFNNEYIIFNNLDVEKNTINTGVIIDGELYDIINLKVDMSNITVSSTQKIIRDKIYAIIKTLAIHKKIYDKKRISDINLFNHIIEAIKSLKAIRINCNTVQDYKYAIELFIERVELLFADNTLRLSYSIIEQTNDMNSYDRYKFIISYKTDNASFNMLM